MDEIIKAMNTLEVAFINGQISKDEIEKARNASGLYSDTLYNRKKGRAGHPYNKRSDMEGHFKGETSSGKKYDVRNHAGHDDYKNFTAQEHAEVAEHHKKMIGSSHGEQVSHHKDQAIRHGIKSNVKRLESIPIEEHRKNEETFKNSLKAEKTKEGIDKKFKEISNDPKYIDMPANLQNDIADYADEVEEKLKEDPKKEGRRPIRELEDLTPSEMSFDEYLRLKGAKGSYSGSESEKNQYRIAYNKTKKEKSENKSPKEDSGLKEKVDYFKTLNKEDKKKYYDTLNNEWIPESDKEIRKLKDRFTVNDTNMIKIHEQHNKFLKQQLLPAIEREMKNEPKKEVNSLTAEIKGDNITSYSDNKGNKFTFKKVKEGFDIFKNGERINAGAKTKGDIKQAIEHYQRTEKESEDFRKESNKKVGKYTATPKTSQSYHKKDGLDSIRDIAAKAKDVNDFMNQVREIKDVSSDVASKFNEMYGMGGKLSPTQASQKLINEVRDTQENRDATNTKRDQQLKEVKEGKRHDTDLPF